MLCRGTWPAGMMMKKMRMKMNEDVGLGQESTLVVWVKNQCFEMA